MQAQQTDQLIKKAFKYHHKGYDAKAGKYLDQILETSPEHADAIFLKGMIAYRESKLEKAEKLIERAIKFAPESAPYYLQQAIIFVEKQALEKAEVSIRRSLEFDPDHPGAQSVLADVLRLQGRYEDAYPYYKSLDKQGELTALGYYYLMLCRSVVPLTFYATEIEQDILTSFRIKNIEHNKFSRFISIYIKEKFKLTNTSMPVQLDALTDSRLLQEALSKVYLQEPLIEQFITAIRKELLITTLETGELPDRYLDLAISIGVQCFNNEYVFYVSSEEQEMLTGLEQLLITLINNGSCQTQDILCAVVVIAMYKLIHETEVKQELMQYSLEQWYVPTQRLIKSCLFDIDDEIKRAGEINSLTNITDETSKAVRAQYEENPYPRWLTMNYVTNNSLADTLKHQLLEFKPPPFLLGKPINILVAGCGTGRQPLEEAKTFRDVNVFAVDLSLRSLAYAQRMAEVYDVKNIEFMQADILDLDKLDRRFHVIFCGGVLHHMQDPFAGWQVLRNLLVPSGLMKIGLYSEIARQHIVKIREIIQTHNIEPTPENIRLFRQGLMHGQLGDTLAGSISKSRDFYCMSGCRDLLFHVQEHRYTLDGIQQSLDQLHLEFLGFDLQETKHKQCYKQMFKHDRRQVDLSNWALYESLHPNLFSNMYQFWCQAF